jgi:DNA-binding MarR family transcriptional regulator
MERYTLTFEGRAMLRRMESRVTNDSSFLTDDFKILEFLYENGAATIDDIVDYMGIKRSELVNRLFGIMRRGYIEALASH